MATVTKTGAEKARWDLSDLFQSPDDPKLEASLADTLRRAKDFESKYKGKVATMEPKPFAAMMLELAGYEEEATMAEAYAYMLHSQNTQDPKAGRLFALRRVHFIVDGPARGPAVPAPSRRR